MSLRNKLHLRIEEFIALRKRCWKQCKKWVTKSKHSFQQNTSSPIVYENTHQFFGTTVLVDDDTNVQNEDSHTSFETDFEEAYSSLHEAESHLTELEKEQTRREKRLARTRNSLRNSSLTNSERNERQRQARRQQQLLAQSERNIRMARQTWHQENQYLSDVTAVIRS